MPGPGSGGRVFFQVMQATVEPPSVPTGATKTFGVFGPKYQVGTIQRPLENGDWMVEITLLETGEKTAYRLSRVLNDPEA